MSSSKKNHPHATNFLRQREIPVGANSRNGNKENRIWDVTPVLVALVERYVLYKAKGEGDFNHHPARVKPKPKQPINQTKKTKKPQPDNYRRAATC